MADLFQDHDCQKNRETKLVDHHMPSRSWDENNDVHLPHSHENRPRVGCLWSILLSFKTNHVPLMNGFKLRKTPHTSSGDSYPPSPLGTPTGCDRAGEGGFCFSSRTLRVCSARFGHEEQSGCTGHRHDVHLYEQVVGCPAVEGDPSRRATCSLLLPPP